MSARTRTSSDAPQPASLRTLWMVEVRESDLALTTRLVAWALATWMNRDGWCYPSVPLIKKATRLGQRTVYDHLKILVDNGFLSRKRGGGEGNPSQYQALVKGAAIGALIHTERVRERTERVRRGALKGAQAGDREVTKKLSIEESNADASSPLRGSRPGLEEGGEDDLSDDIQARPLTEEERTKWGLGWADMPATDAPEKEELNGEDKTELARKKA